MPKISDERLKRVHLQVYESDWEFLALCFGNVAKRSAVVRDLVRNFVNHTRAQEEQRARVVHKENQS